MYELYGVTHRDWKHAWLHAEGWDAFGIWLEARWNPLTAFERLHFVLRITKGNTEHSLLVDEEIDELVEDSMLSIDAYSHDPEVPHHMVTPYVFIDGESAFGSNLRH